MNLNTEEHYLKHENMINSISWKFSKILDIEFDELKSDGNMIYMNALELYDKNKGIKFSTFLLSKLVSRFRHIKRDENNKCNVFMVPVKNPDKLIETTPEILTTANLSFKLLSENAKELIEICFNAPKDLIKMLPRKTINRYQLRLYMTKKRGWTQSLCKKTFREIKFFLK